MGIDARSGLVVPVVPRIHVSKKQRDVNELCFTCVIHSKAR
jgi:hypothetical protein